MTLKLSDFSGYVSEGKEFVSTRNHFFVNGSGDLHIDKVERLSILAKIVDILKPGVDACILYPGAGNAEILTAFKDNADVVKKRNQYFFIGPLSELISLCDKLSDVYFSTLAACVVFKLRRSNIHWEMLFSSLYDPGFLVNAASTVPLSAYRYAQNKSDDNHVYCILTASAHFSPSFLIFDKTKNNDIFSNYAVEYCKISKRFENLYSHFLETYVGPF